MERYVPTGPKGEKRPADVIFAAVKVMRIATGEEPEDYGPEDAKEPAAKGRVVVVHVFAKKTQKTPRREIEMALKRATEVR